LYEGIDQTLVLVGVLNDVNTFGFSHRLIGKLESVTSSIRAAFDHEVHDAAGRDDRDVSSCR
jgi:hypothetical protein